MTRAPLRFIPLDRRAKDGGFHLVRSAQGEHRQRAEYCARWSADRQRWELNCACPVEAELTHWATTLPEIALPEIAVPAREAA